MPILRIKGVEAFDSSLERIEKNLGLGVYEVIEELEKVAQERYQELIAESKITN